MNGTSLQYRSGIRSSQELHGETGNNAWYKISRICDAQITCVWSTCGALPWRKKSANGSAFLGSMNAVGPYIWEWNLRDVRLNV